MKDERETGKEAIDRMLDVQQRNTYELSKVLIAAGGDLSLLLNTRVSEFLNTLARNDIYLVTSYRPHTK